MFQLSLPLKDWVTPLTFVHLLLDPWFQFANGLMWPRSTRLQAFMNAAHSSVCRESKPVHPKGNQSWIFIGKTDAEAEALILWPPNAKSWLLDPDAGKDWKKKEKQMTEDEMVGWHHWLNGHEFKQALGDVKDKEAWHATIHGVAKSPTQLTNWTTQLRLCVLLGTGWLV